MEDKVEKKIQKNHRRDNGRLQEAEWNRPGIKKPQEKRPFTSTAASTQHFFEPPETKG